VTWEEVLLRLGSKYFTSTHGMTLGEYMERIKKKLGETKRILKKEEEDMRRPEHPRSH
jgi:hypothetical protein